MTESAALLSSFELPLKLGVGVFDLIKYSLRYTEWREQSVLLPICSKFESDNVYCYTMLT